MSWKIKKQKKQSNKVTSVKTSKFDLKVWVLTKGSGIGWDIIYKEKVHVIEIPCVIKF